VTTSPAPAYQWAGTGLLRASTDPGDLDLPDDLDLSAADAAVGGLRWLSSVWAREDVRSAVSDASPALGRRIETLLANASPDARRARRAVLSLSAYLLRWQGRATPFGLFAGVAAVRLGCSAELRWGGVHQVAMRADAAWLGAVIDRLHRCSDLVDRLTVVANDACQERGDRVVAPGPPPDERSEQLAPVEVSVRGTRPVRAALEAAHTPVTISELRRDLGRQFPASAQQIRVMLDELITQRLLVSCLWAPMTSTDAISHVNRRLADVGAEDVAPVAGLVRELRATGDDLSGASPSEPTKLARRMTELCNATVTPLVTDTALDCELRLPGRVAQEARDAAVVLLRLSPFPFGYPPWRDYHAAFRARFGSDARVPALELTADSGLGLPAGFLGSARERTPRQVSERDEKLMTLVQQAMADGTGEITLTDTIINDLAAAAPADVAWAPRAEIAAEIHAVSLEAIDRGDFRLVVTGTPRPGSSMIGRHLHLLPADIQESLAGTYAAASPDAVPAQLSFAPRRRRNENVARTRQVLPHVIPIGEHRPPGENLITLDDLAVTADARHFYLVRRSTGEHIEPRVPHALEAGIHTPPLARFLAEIATARCSVYTAFDFGAAAVLPYLPRVRCRRTVLSPARWLLTRSDLPGPAATPAEWEAAVGTWRDRWHMPARVALTEHDRRLPLDLTHPVHRLLLRDHLARHGRAELRETATPQDLAWLGRAHEVLIPLTLDDPVSHQRKPPVTRPQATATTDRPAPSGRQILCAHIYAHPARYDEILTGHLASLTSDLTALTPCWWFRRHRDARHPEADQYLSIYFRHDPAGWAAAAGQVASWAATLRGHHLASQFAVTTSEPQTGRFGDGPAIDLVQHIFAADSAAAITQIRAATRSRTDPRALAAASMTDLAAALAGPAGEGCRQLISELPQQHGKLDPALRDQAIRLTDPAELAALPGGRDVTAAWRARAAALAAYRDSLAGQRDPGSALPALLHEHRVRAVSADPAVHHVIDRLARTCAMRLLATGSRQ
jgi:thiopeptide-type bacteriocin biosynthesis protein